MRDDKDVIAYYMAEVRRHKLLTREQEVELAIASKLEGEPGAAAKKKFAECNLRLVVSVAHKYLGRGLDFSDLVQEGNLGLLKAIEDFDPSLGFKFATYAVWWIRQSITRGISNMGTTIRRPVHMLEYIRAMRKALQKLSHSDTEITDEAVAVELTEILKKPVSVKAVQKISMAMTMGWTDSLNRPIGEEDDDSSLGDFIAAPEEERPDHIVHAKLENEQIRALLDCLNPREKDIMQRRMGFTTGEEQTLEEIGAIYQVTRERIRQIEEKAKAKIRLRMAPQLRALRGIAPKRESLPRQDAADSVAVKAKTRRSATTVDKPIRLTPAAAEQESDNGTTLLAAGQDALATTNAEPAARSLRRGPEPKELPNPFDGLSDAEVAAQMARLTEKQGLVITLLFGLDGGSKHSVPQIARQLSVTPTAVYNCRNGALARLASPPEAEPTPPPPNPGNRFRRQVKPLENDPTAGVALSEMAFRLHYQLNGSRPETAEQLEEALKTLTVRELQVFAMRRGLHGARALKASAVKRLLGVSSPRIGKLYRNAMERVLPEANPAASAQT